MDLGDAAHAGILAAPLADRGDRRFLGEARSVEVREPLREVDGAPLLGEARHLGEDRGAEAREPGGESRTHGEKLSAISGRLSAGGPKAHFAARVDSNKLSELIAESRQLKARTCRRSSPTTESPSSAPA